MSTSKTFSVGQVLPASQMNDLPQGVLGFQAATAAVGPTSGTTELDILSAPSVTLANNTRRLRLMFTCRGISGTVANDVFIVRIKEGATTFAEAAYLLPATGATLNALTFFVYLNNPTAAAHTYKATIQRSSGTGVATVDATATGPITLSVEDVGGQP